VSDDIGDLPTHRIAPSSTVPGRRGPDTVALSRDPAAQTLEDPDDELPASLGRFVPLRELGRGGMGRVLAARDPELGRVVAVKVVVDPSEVNAALLDRFVAEAQITSQLEHPGIVPVHDMGSTEDGQLFFVMKRVKGRSLASVLAGLRSEDPDDLKEWTEHRLLSVFLQVCDAVAYAHSRGVLHRDLKPANIMLGRFGETLVLDWGVALVLETEVTAFGDAAETVGTPGYMSPEQARNDPLDDRSDLWSLGAILYRMLTLRSPYPGRDLHEVMFKVMSGPPPDPRAVADRRVPDALAEIALRALAPEPGDRYPGVELLSAAVRAYLDGSERRARARQFLSEARAAWFRLADLEHEREALKTTIRTQEQALLPWAPLEEKTTLLDARRRLKALGSARAEVFAQVVEAGEKALGHDPGSDDARSLLADAWMQRFREAEDAGDREQLAWFEHRVRSYDDGHHVTWLDGDGSLTLHTEPPGAEVVCERFDEEGLIFRTVERQVLGRTPLVDVPLPMGSYLLTLNAPGKRPTRYPIRIARGRRWSSGAAPIPLFSEAELGADWVYVPGGPFVFGGDAEAPAPRPRRVVVEPGYLIRRNPVTMAEYAEFLTAVHAEDPDRAWALSPRQGIGMDKSGGQYWERPGPGGSYQVPERDRDGDRWEPDWPVVLIMWPDAIAYCAWRSAQDGVALTLPTEAQWEKAARGTDGRYFPWGNEFDPNLCKTIISRAGRPLLETIDAFPTDVSVYGVRHMAGLVSDFTAEEDFDGDPSRRAMRGGSWRRDARWARVAGRYGVEPFLGGMNLGFRMVRPLPG